MPTATQPFRFKWEQAFRRDAVSSGVPASAIGTGLMMATYGNSDGTSIKVSHARLARNLGVTERTIRRNIKALTGSGWVGEVSWFTAPGQTVEYRLSIVDVETGNTGHQCPPFKVDSGANTGHQCPPFKVDSGANTGHQCPPLDVEHRTSVSRTPDTSDQDTGHTRPERRTPVSAYHKDTMDNHGVYHGPKEETAWDRVARKHSSRSPMPTAAPADGMEWTYIEAKTEWLQTPTFED